MDPSRIPRSPPPEVRLGTRRQPAVGGLAVPSTPPRCAPRGFSLLIVLGLMAVLAILALALVPLGLTQIDLEAQQREVAALDLLKTGLRNHILDSRSLPGTGMVFSAVAAKIGWELGMVRTNARGNPRVYLVDPALQLGTNTAATLPYTQGLYGLTNVAGPRLLLLSSLGQALPSVIANPGTNAATVFEMIWNAPENTAPPGWAWGGRWAEINVQRLSLVPLLAQVMFHNSSAQTGRFSMDNTNVHVALPSNPFTALYFVRTLLGLHSDTGALQAVQVMQDVTSLTNGPPYFLCPTFVYESGQWRGRFYKGTQAQKHNGEDLEAAYDLFMSGPANVYQVGSVTQSSVTRSVYVFMSNYVNWANSGFSSSLRSTVASAQSAMAAQLNTYCNKKATVE